MVACLGLGRWDVADRLEQAAIVEPTHPVEGGEFYGIDVSLSSFLSVSVRRLCE